MRLSIAALLLCLFSAAADARCWHGENVSWYVDRHTASGEAYRHDESTCAHRTAKFGTRLRVTDRRTGRSVDCRVNDRGPNKWTKCDVDLNRHAAKQLGILDRGVAHADIVTVPTAAGISITVASSFALKIQGFIADVVARGYQPKQIHCYARGGHVRNSLHYRGEACDFNQRGWGLTDGPMYHVADLAARHGLRDGCTFWDCGHIDSGSYMTARRRTKHPSRYATAL